MYRLFRGSLPAIVMATGTCFVPTPANASTTSTTFSVTSTVQATCIVSASNLSFGNYSGLESDATTTISVSCNTTTPYNVGLGAGAVSGATVTTRKMAGPSSSVINYSLFRDAAHTQNWGNTVGTDTVAGTGNGSSQVITVYGSMPAGQYVIPGSYSDTIVVTVTY